METNSSIWYPADADYGAFGDWDSDGDGDLDADEFNESFDVTALGDSWADDPLDEATFGDAYFELYDDDLDGEVSESEWQEGVDVFEVSD